MRRTGRRPLASLSVVGALLLLLGSQRCAYAIPGNLILDNSPGDPRTHTNVTIRSYGDKVVAVWNDTEDVSNSSEPRIHYATSTDSGATFNDLGGPPVPAGSGRWRGDVQLAVDPANGTFFLVAFANGPGGVGIWASRGLFSGSALTWSAPVLVLHSSTGTILPGLLALDTGPTGNVLQLLYQTGAGDIDYMRSTDGNGASWSGPIRISSAGDSAFVAYPQLATGPSGKVVAAWAGPLSLATQPIRVRTSSDYGVTWGSEQTVTTRMNPLILGASALTLFYVHRPPFSLAVNRATGSSTAGQVALAWGEAWDFTDELFPALTTTVLRTESEPNGDVATATAFNVGEALIGSSSDGNDLDCWNVTLAAGASILCWADTTDADDPIQVSILGPDGSAQDNFYSGGSSTTCAFRAPTAGTYTLQVVSRGIPVNAPYRIRTRAGTPGAGEGRDARDVAVAFSAGAGWTIRHQPFGPVGYDDYLPTIGYAADGLDYVTWYDASRGSVSGAARLVVARNLTGTDPVPSPPVTVSDAETSFNDYLVYYPPGIGCANDIYGEGRRVFLGWTDFRFGSPDVFRASLATDALPIAFPNDTTVNTATTATLHGRVLNRNPEFGEQVTIRVTGARSWPGALVVRDSVPPAATGVISIPIAIPDTAAAGTYTVTVQYERQSGIVLGSHAVALTIHAAAGVDDAARDTRLAPIAPNPLQRETRIAFTLARSGETRLAVYGVQGERVRTLLRGNVAAGAQSLRWDGRNDAGQRVAPGLYFVALESGTYRAVRTLVVLR